MCDRCCTILDKSFMKFTVSCAEIWIPGYNLHHDTVFPHVPMNRRYTQTQTRTMDDYRLVSIRMWKLSVASKQAFQVCSHVLPSASSFAPRTKSLYSCLAPGKSQSIGGKSSVCFYLILLTGAVPCCLVQFFLFVCLRDSLRSGTFAQVSLLCHPSSGARLV